MWKMANLSSRSCSWNVPGLVGWHINNCEAHFVHVSHLYRPPRLKMCFSYVCTQENVWPGNVSVQRLSHFSTEEGDVFCTCQKFEIQPYTRRAIFGMSLIWKLTSSSRLLIRVWLMLYRFTVMDKALPCFLKYKPHSSIQNFSVRKRHASSPSSEFWKSSWGKQW